MTSSNEVKQAPRPSPPPPPFDASVRFVSTRPPNPAWTSGMGRSNGDDKKADRIPYTLIEPGKTEIDSKQLYRVMLGGISPRPIALVGTYSVDGIANLAPMSWYNMVSHDPPLVMVSFGGIRERIKDSERNILANKQYTISCATEEYAEAVNHASINAPTGVSEFALSGLTPVRGKFVNAPRVEEAPFSMELELDFSRQWDNADGDHTTTMIVGRVKLIHVRQDIIDRTSNGIDPAALRPISRFAGTTYGRSTLGYDLLLPRWDALKEDEDVQKVVQAGPKEPHADANEDHVVDKYP